MKLGVVGLPNVGKSTLFNAITQAGAQAANHPFCTIEPNVGMVDVPDKRLEVLSDIFGSKKIIPVSIEFVDIAGLVKGASKGKGRGNKFLSHIREVDAIIHVVRCFEDDSIIHVDGDVSPSRDVETINFELIFADMESLEKRIAKAAKQAKYDKTIAEELKLMEKIYENLEKGLSARSLEYDEDELKILPGLFLITNKPVIYAANISEDEIGEETPLISELRAIAKSEDAGMLAISARVEDEIASLDEDERRGFLLDLGLEESGLDRLIKSSYELLNLISYLTAGEMEARAWTIEKGTKAPQAAGKIHSDFERGFIRAEIVGYNDLVESGSMAAAKEKGLVRLEGKEYVVVDGDVVLFRFNV